MVGRQRAEQLWREQSAWSQTADRMKGRIVRARLLALGTVVLVALAATTAASTAAGAPLVAKLLAGLAAVGSGVLPLLRPAWSGPALKNWTRARSVSEALKSDVYLWLARLAPYQDDDDAVELTKRTGLVLVDAADLEKHRSGIQPVARDLPPVVDAASFFAVRVGGQIDKYYRPRAALLRRRLKQFRMVEIALGAAGVVLGLVAALAALSLAAWIAVVATVTTAFAVHVAATRYEFQEIEFTRTAVRLEQLTEEAEQYSGDPSGLGAAAIKAEDVISIENQGWMAKLSEDPPEQKSAEPKRSAPT